jgi:tetratricopeptide (TPR) repeat protein
LREARTVEAGLVADYPGVPSYRRHLGVTLAELGIVLDETNQVKEAEATFREALAIQQVLVATFPKVPEYRDDMGNTQNSLGNLLSDHLGQMETALTAYSEAARIRRELVSEHPEVTEYRVRLATSLNNLGAHFNDMKRPKDSEKAYREAIALQKELVDKFPDNPEYKSELARSYANLGNLLSKLDQANLARSSYQDGLVLRHEVVKQFPNDPLAKGELGQNLVKLAKWHMTQKEWSAAKALLEEAHSYLSAALAANPRNPEFRRWNRDHLEAGIQLSLGLGDHAAAARDAADLARSEADPATDNYNAACSLCLCIPLARQEPKLSAIWREMLAEVYATRALGYLQVAVVKGFGDLDNIQKDPDLTPLRNRLAFRQLIQAMKDKGLEKR